MAKRVAKFKVGDQVIGNKNAKCYNITKPGWVGKVLQANADYICVSGKGTEGSWVDASKFDAYVAPTKKAVVEKKPEVIKIKDGDYFIATKKGVRGNAAKCCGVVTDTWYNGEGAVLAGTNLAQENDEPDAFEGFPTFEEQGWDKRKETIKDAFGFSTFEIVKDKRQIAIINAHKMVSVEGHSVTVTKDTVSFGCGSVKMKKGQAGVFINILKDGEDAECLDTLMAIRSNYHDDIINDIQKLMTNVLASGHFKTVDEFINLCDNIKNEGVEFDSMEVKELEALEKLIK